MRSLRALPTPLLVLLAAATSTLAIPEDEPLHELQINTITPVTCSRPTKNGDQIKVNYAGRLLSTGAEFDNSYDRGKPFKFRLGAGQVIKGWDQGLLDMCPGEARELTIPPELGYGSHGVGPIPAGATLVFDTELVNIVGVEQESISTLSPTQTVAAETESATEAMFGIATAPPEPTGTGETEVDEPQEPDEPAPTFESEDRLPGDKSPQQMAEDGDGECRLLGPFALIVQGALGAMALLALVYKRFRETPKRPWKIWFFDASKQVMGSMLLHVLNLLMSMLGAGDLAAQAVVAAAEKGDIPNPCSFYILNLGIDTTIGVPVLYVLLKFFHAVFSRTPLANPPESIKTGHYGTPPRTTWYLKQLLIYFTSLIFMKLFVWFLFAALPWLPWVGDWALRWTEGNEALQIAFAMFIFPLAMNAIQYYIVDSFIMDKSRGGQDGYSQVRSEDGDSIEREPLREDGSLSSTDVEEQEVVAGKAKGADEGLTELSPEPIPVREDSSSGQGIGGRSSPRKLD